MKRIFPVLLIAIAWIHCGDPSLSANCNDILPPAQSTFSSVYPLFSGSGDGGCDNCHSTSNPTSHYDFSTRPMVYDALSNHFDIVYAQVASGTMPPEDSNWSDSKLKTLRSWYCYGGFYDQ